MLAHVGKQEKALPVVSENVSDAGDKDNAPRETNTINRGTPAVDLL